MTIDKAIKQVLPTKYYDQYIKLVNMDKEERRKHNFLAEYLKQNPINEHGHIDDNRGNRICDFRNGKPCNQRVLLKAQNSGWFEVPLDVFKTNGIVYVEWSRIKYKVTEYRFEVDGEKYSLKYLKDITNKKVVDNWLDDIVGGEK